MRQREDGSFTVPALKFCEWCEWELREGIKDCDMPGIYLIAIGPKRPMNSIKSANVSYIGMTNSKGGLRSRWRQFDHAIRTGKGKHSGGNAVYHDRGTYKNQWSGNDRLYVCAMPIQCTVTAPTSEDLTKMGWVAFLEYAAFAEYRRHWNDRARPKYNTR